jgi:hypothetical protein
MSPPNSKPSPMCYTNAVMGLMKRTSKTTFAGKKRIEIL